MNAPTIDPPMIDALEGASSLHLYQLKAIIDGMLADPRRGLAARASLHLGQTVVYVIMLAVPLPFIAAIFGWLVREEGRQPWAA